MGHSDGVMVLVFSRDGETLVSAGLDYSIRFWPLEKLVEHNKWLGEQRGGVIALGHDDKSALSTHAGVVRCWELTTGAEEPMFSHIGNGVQNIAISRNEVMAARKAEVVELWSTTTGQRTSTFSVPHELTTPTSNKFMALSLNGLSLAVGGQDEQSGIWKVLVWNMEASDLPNEITVPAAINCLVAQPGRAILVCRRRRSELECVECANGEKGSPTCRSQRRAAVCDILTRRHAYRVQRL